MTDDEVEAQLPALLERAEQAARRVLRDRAAVADVVAHAQEKVWQRRDALDQDRVLSWVGQVAYRRAIDEARRLRKLDGLDLESSSAAGPGWAAELEQRRQAFLTMSDQVAYENSKESLLSLLPAGQAAALRLSLDGHSTAQIARELGISEEAVRKRLFDARANLREALGDDVDGLIPRQMG